MESRGWVCDAACVTGCVTGCVADTGLPIMDVIGVMAVDAFRNK